MSQTTTVEGPAASLSDRVAASVRAGLAAKKRSSAELAVVLGMQPRAAQRRLRGEVAFTISEVGVIADWLGVPYSALMAEWPGGAA